MGPIIILDKSVLQSLSFEEIKFLRRHYLVNIVPVLVIEILGNLKKYADDEARSQDIVKQHADKFSPLEFCGKWKLPSSCDSFLVRC